MLELKNIQKSSVSGIGFENFPTEEIRSPRVYVDGQKALEDFDQETRKERQSSSDRFQNPKISTLYANASLLFKSNEFSLALNLLRTASNLDSKNIAILNLMAECLEQVQSLGEALKIRNAIVSIDCNFDTVQKLASLYYKLGQDEFATSKYYEALSMLVEEDDAIFDVYKNLGNIFVRRGDFEGAEDHYNKAYAINPESDTLLVNFGTLEVQRQDFDKSLYCFRQAITINSVNDKAWVGLAMVHAHFGDQELAWANLETAIDINPENRTAVHLLANWSLRDNRAARGISALEEYLGKVDFDEQLSLVLINLFCSNSQIAEAKLECERVLLWNPNNSEVADLKKRLRTIKRA